MEKLTLAQVRELCLKHNEENNIKQQFEDKNALRFRVVFTEKTFGSSYSEIERTYEFFSDNKYFIPNMLGSSLYGNCLDGKDYGVRLDWCIGDGWEIDYCYQVKVCCICGKSIEGWGNNPDGAMFKDKDGKLIQPVYKDTDVCCDECNSAYVLTGRLYALAHKGGAK